MATTAASNTNTTNPSSKTSTSNANSSDSDKLAPRGVYKNPRLMHVSTTIVGCTVQLQTRDTSVWEGLFATFSPEFSICLEFAVKIDPKLKSQDCLFQALKTGSKAQERAIFDLKDIVSITVNDVDLNYAIKEMDKMVTDADISGFNSSKSGERRELESWQDDDGDDPNEESLLSLDEVAISTKNGSQNNSRTGWDAQEMFRYNERVHKVNSTYDEDLHDYTIALPKPGKHDKDWRKKQDRAAAIAREIETNPQSQVRLAKEDGSDDEEEKFSSVVRPQGEPTTHRQQQQPSSTLVQQQPLHQAQHQQHIPNATNDSAPPIAQPSLHQHQNQHQQSQSNQHHLHQHQYQHQQHPRQIPNRINNANHKNLRPNTRTFNPRSTYDSLKNFGRQLHIAPAPRQPQNQISQMQGSPAGSQGQNSPQQPHQKQSRPQHPQHQATQSQLQQQSQGQQHQPSLASKQQASHTSSQPSPQQAQQPVSQQHPQSQPQLQQPQQQTPQSQPPQQIKSTPSGPTTTPLSTNDTSLTSERSDTSSSMSANQQSELAKKSTLNPNAKEFVYKPKSPASIQSAQSNGANQAAVGLAPAMDPNNPSPMAHTAQGAYYQQVPIFSHGLPPHQQQPHHPSQFMPNHAHMHFQSQIHYMPTPMAPHFAPQQVSPRYIRGNFQNYHHRNGEHMNNVRAAYPQTSIAVPTSASGQPYVPQPNAAQPHHLNTFAMSSPQQSIVYGGPPQSVYPMAPANFHQQHMSHVPNPQTYEGYMPQTQNYVINQ